MRIDSTQVWFYQDCNSTKSLLGIETLLNTSPALLRIDCNSTKSLLGIETFTDKTLAARILKNCNSTKSLLGIETERLRGVAFNLSNCNSTKSLLGIETNDLCKGNQSIDIAIQQNPY